MVFEDCTRFERVRGQGVVNGVRIFLFRAVSGRSRDANVVNCQVSRSGQATQFVLPMQVGRRFFDYDGRRAYGFIRERGKGEQVFRHVSVRFVFCTISAHTTSVHYLLGGRQFISVRQFFVRPRRRYFGVAIRGERVVQVGRRFPS